ncbi:exodeoxyribonuclease III [Parvularcula dongshanensis]|uniref:Exodeoxyribonuclease-3 n=1 Tax=Parvularcula dongshanensis TaxID=1173995 RepID=A0A840I7H7_9PROT|nr:exodeoxyribonuclease III [Parvularcula dongshanensis]MBB4660058.1 exodeoxyribonuclease-3 [Parvularcula dongshanensis]
MKIASWNVNSVGARLPRVLDWFSEARPDVCVLQEIKCVDEKFPAEAFEDLGYDVHVHGQKTYNGVALLSRHPVEDVRRGLPEYEDEHSRYIEALIVPEDAAPLRVGGLYLPNGNPAPGPKYDYKLAWMEALEAHAKRLLATEEAFALGGDYNVIPNESGVYDPSRWLGDALFRIESRQAYRRILNLGLTDALPQLMGEPYYTFWDYQRGAWDKNNGLRIDHWLLSPQAADRLEAGGVDAGVRDPNTGSPEAKPSDHVPVWVEIA